MGLTRKITIPTYITLSRFILVPIFIYLFLKEKYMASLIVLVISGLTDAADGYIARRFNMRSKLGSLLDPLADKFLMVVSFWVLTSLGRIPAFLTYLVISRDGLIILGAFILAKVLKINLFYRPTYLSKVTTTVQIFLLSFAFLGVLIEKRGMVYSPPLHAWTDPIVAFLIYSAFILTAITAIQYAWIGYKFLRFGERRK